MSADDSSFWARWLLGGQLIGLDVWPPTDPKQSEQSVTIARLNWSIQWHTLANRQAMRWYTGLKAIQISAAAAIPVLVAIGGSSSVTKGWIAGLGALIVVLEGIQQLKKYAQNGLLWGQGKEALKREYYLYQAKAYPYNQPNQANCQQLLASRIEQIVGQEVTKWADLSQDTRVEPGGAHNDSNSAS
jgi:Protein of unknown function (DUF4231)